MRKYHYDIIDGVEVPPLVVRGEREVIADHKGTIHVELGSLIIEGNHMGTLVAHNGTEIEITGKQSGTVSIRSGALVTVYGTLSGTTSVEPASVLVIEEQGRLSGTLSNDGSVIVRGVFGGARTGSGKLELEGRGYIKEPVTKNGFNYYEW